MLSTSVGSCFAPECATSFTTLGSHSSCITQAAGGSHVPSQAAHDWVDLIYDLASAYVLIGDYANAAPLFDRLAELTGSDPEGYRCMRG
jgi:hypothetical protein